MSYTLSGADLAKFIELSQLIRGTKSPADLTDWPGTSADYTGKYFLAYDFLAAVQTTTSGGVSTPKAIGAELVEAISLPQSRFAA